MPPAFAPERVYDWRFFNPSDARWASLLERVACYYFPYSPGWEKKAAAFWKQVGQRASLDGRSLDRPVARGTAVLFATHLKPVAKQEKRIEQKHASRFQRRVSVGSRSRLKSAPFGSPTERAWANPDRVPPHKNAARLHISIGQIMFLDSAGPGPLVPAKLFLDDGAERVLGGACIATDPLPPWTPPGTLREDGAASLGSPVSAACTIPAGSTVLHVPLGSRPLFPTGGLVVVQSDGARQMGICTSAPAWNPRPSQIEAGKKTLQMKLASPLAKKVPAGAAIGTSMRPPVLWDSVTAAHRLTTLTDVRWRDGLPPIRKKTIAGASVSEFVQQLRDQHAQDKADVTAADDASKCIGSPWQHTVYARIEDLLASKRPAAASLIKAARQFSTGPSAILWPGNPDDPKRSPPCLIVDAGSLTATFYKTAVAAVIGAARDLFAEPDFAVSEGEREAAEHIRTQMSQTAEAARLKLDTVVLPHCVRSMLPGGDMHARCIADSSLHLKNVERFTAAVVLGAALPTVGVADIEDMLAPVLGDQGKREFRSYWQYARRSLRKSKAGGLFSCRKLTGGSAGTFRPCPFADDPVGAFEACTGCRTAPANYNKNPLGALIALSTDATPKAKRSRVASAPEPAAR